MYAYDKGTTTIGSKQWPRFHQRRKSQTPKKNQKKKLIETVSSEAKKDAERLKQRLAHQGR